MWVEITEKEIIFIAETGVSYKLAKHFITEEEDELLKNAIEDGKEKLYLPYCNNSELDRAKSKEKERDEIKTKERDEIKAKERNEEKAKEQEEVKVKEHEEEKAKESEEAKAEERKEEKMKELNLKPAADNISASERQNEKIITTLAEIQCQLSEMDKRMKHMELNQQKLADKVEANHNEVFEYVDKELNTMWNELNDQIESVRNQAKEAKGQTTAMVVNLEVNPTPTKCFNCDDFGHIGRNCPHTGTGVRVCFECKQLTKYIAAQCPQRLAKEGRKNSQQRH